MEQIRLGLQEGIDVEDYGDPFIDPVSMEICREEDNKEKRSLELNEEQTQEILKGIMSGVDVSLYADSHYSAGQMEQIRMALEAGKDVSPILDCNMSPEYMEQMRLQM